MAQTCVNHRAQHASDPPAWDGWGWGAKALLAEQHSNKEEKHSPPNAALLEIIAFAFSLHNCLETTKLGPAWKLSAEWKRAAPTLSQERCAVSSLSQAHYTRLSDAAAARAPPGLLQLCAQLSGMSAETMWHRHLRAWQKRSCAAIYCRSM